MSFEIRVKWQGKEFEVPNLLEANSVADLKAELFKLTCVLPERQKLLGLKTKSSKIASDKDLLNDLNYKKGSKIMMMGTCEEKIDDMNKEPENLPEVINDLDIVAEEVILQNREENLAKIAKRVEHYKIKVFNEPRKDKKLLVLDIDYTLFDHVSHAERGIELQRPFLHEFLTAAYEDYDIVIWSATSMKWIEVKMNEIGVSTNPGYKIAFYVDCGAMITVHAQDYGVCNVKPLKVIWDKFPEFYSQKNTIMFDDLRRNFLMNPQNGLKIEAYRNAHTKKHTDRELEGLSIYLKKISTLNDLSDLNHKHWKKKL
jgi:ubiquitin-like domain-containing CTD phosphatase 1